MRVCECVKSVCGGGMREVCVWIKGECEGVIRKCVRVCVCV